MRNTTEALDHLKTIFKNVEELQDNVQEQLKLYLTHYCSPHIFDKDEFTTLSNNVIKVIETLGNLSEVKALIERYHLLEEITEEDM